MNNNFINVKLKNPKQFGISFTEKPQWYLKLDSNILMSPSIMPISGDALRVLLAIIFKCLSDNSDTVSMSLGYLKIINGNLENIINNKENLEEIKKNNENLEEIKNNKENYDIIKVLLGELELNKIIELEKQIRCSKDRSLIVRDIVNSKSYSYNNIKNIKKEKDKSTNVPLVSIADASALVSDINNSENNSLQAKPKVLFSQQVLELWNAGCEKHGLAKIKVLNATRKKKIEQAKKFVPDIEDWKKIFYIASTKGFTGNDGRKFVPNFDYVFRNDNYIKFLEENSQKPVYTNADFEKEFFSIS